MSDQIKDGGAAFPVQDAATWHGHGMSLRDYFAAMTLSSTVGVDVGEHPAVYARFARHSYALADAMLAAREAKS